MASAPLNWLLKIGADALNTTAKTICAAINELNTSKADKTTALTASSSLNAAKLTGTVPSSCYTNTTVTSAGATLTTITASTTDITAGSTKLTTGQLYVVYE